jgi:hypothetical protein
MAAPLSPLPPTVADRDAEIAALQTAFDEYIASSRELEDELDAELAKMRKFHSLDLIQVLRTCIHAYMHTCMYRCIYSLVSMK